MDRRGVRSRAETRRGSVRDNMLRRLAPLAGPALIVVAVLVVDQAFAFGGKLTNQHEDVLGLTLPTYCFLGKSLAAGHIPLWNPYSLVGLPFAADPQSGWGYLPAMVLFSALSCGRAMRWYIVLQPILAGLGIYAFLRGERVSRPAATAGGLVIALVMAGSYVGLSIAVAAAVAWTSLLLAATSRYWRAATWPARLGWLALTALAIGQLAGAYAADGLAYGVGAVGVYVVVRAVADLRSNRGWKLVGGLIAMLAAASLFVNMAYLLPRLGYVSRATTGLGYEKLITLQSQLTGVDSPIYRAKGQPPAWPLGLTVSPGSYVALAALLLVFAAFFSRQRRSLAVGFGVFGLVSYLLSSEMFAGWVRDEWPRVSLVDFYLHDPRRFRYALLIAIAVLAGLGVEAWLTATTTRARLLMLAPGAVVWLVLPLLFDVPGGHSGVWVFGLLAGGAALAVAWRKPALAFVVPAVIAVEMVASGLSGQATPYLRVGLGQSTQDPGAFPGLQRPVIDAGAYARPDAIAKRIATGGGGRFVTFDPRLIQGRDAYLALQTPQYWALEANGRGMISGIEDVQGYNSVAPIPYWAYSRTADPHPTRYNVTFYRNLTPQILDLLDVGWVVGGGWKKPPVPGLVPVTASLDPRAPRDPITLYRVTGPALDVGTGFREHERATFVDSWKVVGSAQEARDAVTAKVFDPRAIVVLTADPGLGPSPEPSVGGGVARAAFRATGSQSADIDVVAPTDGLVLVRIPWDPHWTATVDGEPAPVLEADSFLQAIPVRAGQHKVRIAYRDGSVGLGMMIGLLSLGVILGVALVLHRRRRAGGRHREAPPKTMRTAETPPPGAAVSRVAEDEPSERPPVHRVPGRGESASQPVACGADRLRSSPLRPSA